MLKYEIDPRFSESDPLGHVNNTVVPVWFEQARNPIFEIFNPGLKLDKWNIILKRFEVDFEKQIFFGKPVEIRTFIEKIGNSSLVIEQQAWQGDSLTVTGKTVMVYFDFETQKSMPITDDLRRVLQALVGSTG